MGDELKAKFAAEVELNPGANGIYDLAVDGRLIFSKHKEGRFPELEEVVGLIENG